MPRFAGFAELNRYRRKLRVLGVIGVDASGVGFGNLSIRNGATPRFYIIGSATAGIAELMEHDLIERGVPRDRIVRFVHDGENTIEVAQALTRLVKERKWHSVIVVTSNFHTRRTRYVFEHVFPETVAVRVASASDGDFDPQHWWEKRKSLKELTQEFAGMMANWWELRGKNEKKETTQSVVELGGLNPLLLV